MNKNNILSNKKILIPVVIFLILSFSMVVLAVFNAINKNNNPYIITEDTVDPASGQKINKTTGGPRLEKVTNYVGFEDFVANGVNFNKFLEFKNTIRTYNSKHYKKEQHLKRVSLYKDSYKTQKNEDDGSLIQTFKIELDIDQKTLWVKIITTSPFRYKFELYDDEKMTNRVFERNYCDPQVCSE